jgi:hypothetical protein
MQKQISGFEIFYIYDVPPGQILNKHTVKDYPLIECDTWISKDRNWFVQHLNAIDLQLIPNTEIARSFFFSKTSEVIGTIEEILNWLNVNWPNYNKE